MNDKGNKGTAGSAEMPAISRRGMLRAGAGAALSLLGGMSTALSSVFSSSAVAASAGQLVLGLTQEAVNFNPLLVAKHRSNISSSTHCGGSIRKAILFRTSPRKFPPARMAASPRMA